MESTLTFTLQEGGGSKKKKSCRLTDDFVTNHNNYDYLFKIVVVGGSTVGKSSILQRYADNKFSESQTSTLGVDFKIVLSKARNQISKLQLWDISATSESYQTSPLYYRGAQAVIVVYDITNSNSFDSVKIWLNEITRFAHPNVHRILVGNKADLDIKRKVTHEQGKQLAQSNKMMFFETSAKDGYGIHYMFDLIRDELISHGIDIPTNPRFSVRFESKQKQKQTGCTLL